MISINLIHNPDPISLHRKIVDRIDTDKDGYVTHTELHYWIKHRQRRYIEENVDKHWKDYDKNQDGKISWEEYKNTTYGYYLGKDPNSSDPVFSLLLPLLYFFLYHLLFFSTSFFVTLKLMPLCQPLQL